MFCNVRSLSLIVGLTAVVILVSVCRPGISQDADSGEAIFREQCAACHGGQGQGAEAYPRPLAGPLSVAELAELIQRTMPEDKPESLSPADSNKVAAFVFDSFYSPIARARIRPPRIELARLSVEQYRQSLADLIGAFIPVQAASPDQGLTAQYFASRSPNDRRALKLTRTDPVVDFDFGTEPPIAEIEDPRNFSARWSGAIRAPETGTYTLSVTTEHAVKIYLNAAEPLIDGWVKSRGENQHQAQVYLIGGERYPVVVDFSKSKQGVDDSNKKKKRPPVPPASVVLQWQRPGGVLETIPARFLSPKQTQARYICETPFPPDDRSYGWVRATTVSRQWDQATTAAALDAAVFINQRLDLLLRRVAA